MRDMAIILAQRAAIGVIAIEQLAATEQTASRPAFQVRAASGVRYEGRDFRLWDGVEKRL